MLRRRRWALLCAGALGLLVESCLEEPPYACAGNDVCVLNGVQGTCDTGTRTCIYIGPECMSGYRNGRGECVVPSMPVTTTTSETSNGEADSSSSSSSSDGGFETWLSTGSVVECGSGSDDITSEGTVSAGTMPLPGSPVSNAVDGDLTTSWFAAGAEVAGAPTTFGWVPFAPRCILGVEIDGNGLHEDAELREGWGFERVTIRVLGPSSESVFEETRQLPGTPDPHLSVPTTTDGVLGSRIFLDFSGHENEMGAGFAELKVLGQ